VEEEQKAVEEAAQGDIVEKKERIPRSKFQSCHMSLNFVPLAERLRVKSPRLLEGIEGLKTGNGSILSESWSCAAQQMSKKAALALPTNN
jgi:hypothetical protein